MKKITRRGFLKIAGATTAAALASPYLDRLALAGDRPPRNEYAISKIAVAPDATEFDFTFMADTHVPFDDAGIMKTIVRKVNEIGPDLVMHGGDGVQVGNSHNLSSFLRVISKFDAPFIMSPGNHDTAFDDYSNITEWTGLFGKPYYYFDVAHARFIMLNNANYDLGLKQWQFLEQALETDRIKFVIQHRPVEGVNSLYSTPMHDSEKFITMMTCKGVSHVMCGHEHHYAKYEIDDTVYLVSGGAGGRLNDNTENNFHHFLHLQVRGDDVSFEIVRV